MVKKYLKPHIVTKKIKINLFSNRKQYQDDFLYDMLALTYYPDICVAQGTKIILADKTECAIEKVQAGQLVISYDTERKVFSENVVKSLIIHKNENTNGCYLINNCLKITGNHNLWTKNRGWVRVDKLSIGDLLLNNKTELVPVVSLEWKKGDKTVYNLHLDSPNTYFANGILIHNAAKS